jgi:hypothetical protein
MQYFILFGVLLDYLTIHFCQIFLRLFHKAGYLPAQVTGIALFLELRNSVTKLGVLVAKLLQTTHAHFK